VRDGLREQPLEAVEDEVEAEGELGAPTVADPRQMLLDVLGDRRELVNRQVAQEPRAHRRGVRRLERHADLPLVVAVSA
jgi:hypothetical protein